MNRQITVPKRWVPFILALFLVFAGGYLTGRQGYFAQGNTDTAGHVITNEDKGKPKEVDFSLFWDAWKVVEDKYVKEPDDQERVYGAIAGMVAGLGDPFSMFMKPIENQKFNEEISGNFEGIGAQLIQKDGLITVVAPLEDSPAEKAGIVAGDIVIKIDDKDAPATLEEAVNLIRGDEGTSVKLTLIRDGVQREVTVTRQNIEVKSVTSSIKDGVAVIKINQFSANTTTLLDKEIEKIKASNPKAMVLDLRNNPGGLLNIAVDITSRFMEPGVVVIERDRANNETVLQTTEVKSRVPLPLVVLVNKGSASASEIFAGALQDAGRAQIVGETTFGKGSVQAIQPLKDGSAVRITIAEWLTPKKREINKQGIKPDIEVKLTEEDTQANRDPQLDKALELLK